MSEAEANPEKGKGFRGVYDGHALSTCTKNCIYGSNQGF